MENAPTNKTDIKKMNIKQLIVLVAFAVLCLIEYVLFPLILPAELGELFGDHILFFVLLMIMLGKFGIGYLFLPTIEYHTILLVITRSSDRLGWWWAKGIRNPHRNGLYEHMLRDACSSIYSWTMFWLVALLILYLFIRRGHHQKVMEESVGFIPLEITEKSRLWGKIIVNFFVHFAGFVVIFLCAAAGKGNDSYKVGVIPTALACNIPTVIGLFIKPVKCRNNILILLIWVIIFNALSIYVPFAW